MESCQKMKISIGSDHKGYQLKEFLKAHFTEHEWSDVGTLDDEERTDYPVFSKKVCKEVLDEKVERGILLCGSGIGMAIAANRFSGIYAALCWSAEVACVAREDDLANVLVLAADFIDDELAVKIVDIWLSAEFKGGRYQERLNMIDEKGARE